MSGGVAIAHPGTEMPSLGWFTFSSSACLTETKTERREKCRRIAQKIVSQIPVGSGSTRTNKSIFVRPPRGGGVSTTGPVPVVVSDDVCSTMRRQRRSGRVITQKLKDEIPKLFSFSYFFYFSCSCSVVAYFERK